MHAINIFDGFFRHLQLPGFGSPINHLSSPQFCQSTQMLEPRWGAAPRTAALIRCIKLAVFARSTSETGMTTTSSFITRSATPVLFVSSLILKRLFPSAS
jgi:hypothetical protein